MPTVLSWNLYHGTYVAVPPPTVAGASPMDRLLYIAQLSVANLVDVVCLQEVPQASLDPLVAFGIPAPGTPAAMTLAAVPGFAGAYTVLQAFREDNPVAPQATNTTDGYLILYRNAAFPGGFGHMGFYNAGMFANAYGATLRPPLSVRLLAAGGTIRIMNWHAETGPGAGISLAILDGIGNAGGQPYPTAIAGDFNVRGDFAGVFGGAVNFANWDNIVAHYPVGALMVEGVDHILTSQPGGPVLGHLLNFTSDAYHYPIAAHF